MKQSIPSFVGIVIIALGVALVYVGLNNWGATNPLILPASPRSGASGAGGGGFR